MKICNNDKKHVLKAIRQGNIDSVAGGFEDLIDEIILSMEKPGILSLLEQGFDDKRDDNLSIPLSLSLFLTLSAAAKIKLKTSGSDIPYAITDIQTLAKLGFNLVDTERSLEEGLMSEGMIRHFVNKYKKEQCEEKDSYSHSLVNAYNSFVQKQLMPSQNMNPDIHILDCTKLDVNMDNANYEKAEIVKDNKGAHRGYKMANLRGITGDIGILEEVKLGSIKMHNIELCRDMLITTPVFKPGDTLINDRGFLDRMVTNILKSARGVDTYIPVKKNMDIYSMAVSTAIEQKEWDDHPPR